MRYDAVFFDVDGTLVVSSPLMGKALEEAFKTAGKPIVHDTNKMSGRVDYEIICSHINDFDLDSEEKKALAEQVSKNLVTAVVSILKNQPEKACPGVNDLLNTLKETPVKIGLLTGNLHDIVLPKLENAGIDASVFTCGGFGDHSPNRAETARRALESVTAADGSPIDPDRVLIIGDTPNDIACARSVHANVLSVTTGKYSATVLNESHPDYIIENFSDTEKVMSIILHGKAL